MFGQFEDFNQQQNKGLFTFYREQAEKQEQIKRLKKQRKLAKMREAQQKKRKQDDQIKQIKQLKQQKQSPNLETKVRYEFKSQRSKKDLHQPKNRRQKYHKQQLGSSVVIVNSKQISNEPKNQQIQRSIQQKNNLRKIQQMINPHNNNRYFLQNRELPIAFGKGSLQKLILKNQQAQKQQPQTKNTIKQSYFNSYSTQSQKKYIPTFSYQKLPQLISNKPAHSQIILPRRYKSKKVEIALKSNNSQLIRQIRQSLKQQSILEKCSYIDANIRISTNDQINSQRQFQNRLHSQLDAKQRRLIDILRNGSHLRKNKYI